MVTCALASGVISIPADGLAHAAASSAAPNTGGAIAAADHPVRRLIIATADGRPASAAVNAAVARLSGTRAATTMRQLAGGASLVALSSSVSSSAARAAARALALRPDVIFAEPDLWARPTATSPVVPDDPSFTSQWDLWDSAGATGGYSVKAPAAWGTTTGLPSIVVAVIDTGVTSHPDLVNQLVQGYDFVGLDSIPTDSTPDLQPYTANDGDGRDGDPSDPGDWVSAAEDAGTDPTGGFFSSCGAQDSTWHGTHVTGTIVAEQDNAFGISGIAPSAKVEPVRAMGKCGGYLSDINDSIVWASGGIVSGAPANLHPASVLNLSLTGDGPCPTSTQSAINDARSRGVTVVAAAGNEARGVSATSDSAGSWPADCVGVISVAASTRAGELAWYSNFGTVAGSVTLAAPGGDGTGPGGDIYSTLNTGTTVPDESAFGWYFGTSMATPHVSAAVALMQSFASTPLTPDAVKARLVATSTSFPSSSGCTEVRCGAGILNIGRTLSDPPPPLTAPVASFTAARISPSSLGLRFTDRSTSGPAYVTWSFGDGAVLARQSPGATVTHVYKVAKAYKITLLAHNVNGFGAAFVRTISVTATPATPPRPTIRTLPIRSVLVSWVAPVNNGLPILRYLVRCSSPGMSSRFVIARSSLRAYTVAGLGMGNRYTCTVTAGNALGYGHISGPSLSFFAKA
ncbi:unannotated protein [freshwater metagenome]|uniref:Unannotated protein n=1 Tax=freshwater metagenome TaxID=449393 RepID=A0A6J7KEM7_9ZZZZ